MLLLLLRPLLDTGVVEPPVVPTPSGEVSLRRVYIRKRGKLYLFDSIEEADAWAAADEAAEKAIKEAQRTSRRARKRLRERIYKVADVQPLESVDIDQLSTLVNRYAISADLPRLVTLQQWDEVMRVHALAAMMQDEEEVELLLMFM